MNANIVICYYNQLLHIRMQGDKPSGGQIEMCVLLNQVKWCSELQCNIYPHFLEKNKDEADTSKQKLAFASIWNGSSGKKLLAKKYEYTSTSILGRVYELVENEEFDKLSEGFSPCILLCRTVAFSQFRV